MRTFPVGRSLEMRTFTQYLDSIGVPWRARAERIGLPGHIPAPDSYLPSLLVMQFLADIVMREDFPELSVLASLPAYERFGAFQPTSKLETAFMGAPSLYAGMEKLSSLSGTQWSSFRFWLRETDRRVWLCSAVSYSGNCRGLEQQVQARLIRVVGLVQHYLGFHWRPDTLLLETRSLPSRLFAEVLDCPRILPGASFSAVPIEKSLLTRSGPCLRPESEPHLTQENVPSAQSWNLVDCLRSILPEYVIGNQVCLEDIAGVAHVSERTLQRALRQNSVTFRELVENARYKVAREMLADETIRIDDVSQMLGYSDATHFTRAFRRTAGRTPSEYRHDIATWA